MEKQLTVGGILGNGISIGLKNFFPLLGAFILWLLTIWIPYLNVGTTIGLMVGVIAAMGRGQTISPTTIFQSQYRKHMGQFFLVLSFVSTGIYFGMLFLVVPGIVIAISWSLATLLVVDKGENPIEAIHNSNELTYGKKWTIFFAGFLFFLVLFIAELIVMAVFSVPVAAIANGYATPSVLPLFISLIIYFIGYVIWAGMSGYIYIALTEGENAGAPPEASPAV